MLFKDKMKSNWPLVILSGNVAFVPIMSVWEKPCAHAHTQLCNAYSVLSELYAKTQRIKCQERRIQFFLLLSCHNIFLLQWRSAAWGENKTSVRSCPGPWVQVWISWSITKIQKRERRIEIRDTHKKKKSEVLDVWVDIGHGGNRQKGLNERWARGETEQGQTERR